MEHRIYITSTFPHSRWRNGKESESKAENEIIIIIIIIIIGWHHQTSGNERQDSKRISQEN